MELDISITLPSIIESSSIVLTNDTAAIEEVKGKYFEVIDQTVVRGVITVTTPDDFTKADRDLGRVQDVRKLVAAKLEEIIVPRRATLDQWYALRRELMEPLDTAEADIKRDMGRYKQEEAKRIQEAERVRLEAIQIAARAADEALKASQSTELSAIDRIRARNKAKAIVEVQAAAPPPPRPIRGSRSSAIPTKTWKVTNMMEFLRGVVAGTIPIEAVDIHTVNMNALWKMNQGKVTGWPGVGVEEGMSIRGK